jgi:hypothetical protein
VAPASTNEENKENRAIKRAKIVRFKTRNDDEVYFSCDELS